MAFDSFIINSSYKEPQFSVAGFKMLSDLNALLEGVRLERRKHTELTLNTATTMPVALNGMADSVYTPDAKSYIFDIETLPSMKIGNEYIPDTLWQYSAKRDGEVFNVYSGIDPRTEKVYRSLFLDPKFKYEELTRQEKVVADTLARIGKNYDSVSGIADALVPLNYKDYADPKGYQDLIAHGIDALANEGDATELIAKEVIKHVKDDTTLVTFNGKSFDVNMTSQQIARDPLISKKTKNLAIKKLTHANHYDPYKEIRAAFLLNPEAMREAYSENILGSDIAKQRLLGNFTGWTNKQTSYGLPLGFDVNAAHSAVEDIGVFDGLLHHKGFKGLLAKAIEINNSPQGKIQYKVNSGATVFNTSSLWGRDKGILMFQKNEDGFEFPQFSARVNSEGTFTAYNNSPIITNSAYRVRHVGQLDPNDSGLGSYIYRNANELGIKGVDDIHYIALEEASGRGPVKYIMGSKKVLEDTFVESFRVLSNVGEDGITYNPSTIAEASRSLGITLGRIDEAYDEILKLSSKRSDNANAWDRLESGSFKREANITGPILRNFAETERNMALNIIGDALELGTDVATAASARKAGDTGGIITDDFMKRTEHLFGMAKKHYGIDPSTKEGRMFSVAAVERIIDNINNDDLLTLINMVDTEANAIPGVQDYHKTVAFNFLAKEYHNLFNEKNPQYGTRATISDKFLDGISKQTHLSGAAFSFSTLHEDKEKAVGSIKNTMARILTKPGSNFVSRSDYVKGYSVLIKNIFGSDSHEARSFKKLVAKNDSNVIDFSNFLFDNVQQLRFGQDESLKEIFRTSSTPDKNVSLLSDSDTLNKLRQSTIKNLKALSSQPIDSANSIYNYLMGNITRSDFDVFSNRNNYADNFYNEVSSNMKSLANQLEFFARKNEQNILIRDGKIMMGTGNTYQEFTNDIPLLKKLNGVPVLAFGNTNIAMNPTLNFVPNKQGQKSVQIGIKGLSVYDHIGNSVKYTLENHKGLGELTEIDAFFKTMGRIKKDLNISYSRDPIEGTTSAILPGYAGVLDASLQLDTSGIKEDFKTLYRLNILTDEHIKASGIAPDWQYTNFQNDESRINEFIRTYINKNYNGVGSVFNEGQLTEQGTYKQTFKSIEKKKVLEQLIYAKDSEGLTPIEKALLAVEGSGKVHSLSFEDKNLSINTNDGSGINFASSINIAPEMNTSKNAVHNTVMMEGAYDNTNRPNINYTARNDTARSYNKSTANASLFNPTEFRKTLKDAGLSENYETNKNILNYKHNSTDGRYVFNGTNVVMNARLEDGQTVVGEREKIFNIAKNEIERKYNRKLANEEIQNLKSAIDLNSFGSLHEGSALMRTAFIDAIHTSNNVAGATNFNLYKKTLNQDFAEKNIPIVKDANGRWVYRDSQSMSVVRKGEAYNIFSESNAYGELQKIAKTNMFGQVNFYSDNATRLLSPEEVKDILNKIGTADTTNSYESLIATLKQNGVDVMVDFKPINNATTKVFAEGDKLTTAGFNTAIGTYDKKLGKIFKGAGFGASTEKQLNWKFVSSMLQFNDELATAFFDSKSKDKPNLEKLRKDLAAEYGSIENALDAIRKERDIVDIAFGKYFNNAEWTTASGQTEAAKRADVFRLTNRVLNDLVEGLDESDREETLSRVAKSLKDKNTFVFSGNNDLGYNYSSGKIEFSGMLKDIGTKEITVDGKTSVVSRNWGDVLNDIKSALKEDEIKKIDKDYLNEKNKFSEEISYIAFNKDYSHQKQVATFDSVSTSQIKRIMLNSESVAEASILFDKNSDYYKFISSKKGNANIGDDIVNAYSNIRYSQISRKEEQKIAKASSFAEGSLEDIINKEYLANNIIATEEHIKERASYTQQLALAKRNNASRSGSQVITVEEFDELSKKEYGAVEKASLKELNQTFGIQDIKFDDRGNVTNIGHFRGNIASADGKYHFNYDMHFGRTYGNEELKNAQTAYVRQAEEMINYINAEDYEKARIAQNNLSGIKDRINNATTAALKTNSDLSKSVNALTVGYRIGSESMRIDDSSDFLQSRKYINGMTVKELQEMGYTPAIAVVGQDRLEEMGLIDRNMTTAEKTARLRQIREEGVDIMLDRQPHNYTKSIAYAKVYYDPSVADNAIRTNTAFNMLAKADHDGDKIYLTKVLEAKMSNGTAISTQDMLASDLQYRKTALNLTPENLRNEYYDAKTYSAEDVKFEQGSVADNMVRSRLTNAAGEFYNTAKGLEKVVGDLKVNEQVMVGSQNGVHRLVGSKQLVADVMSSLHETFLSPKNFEQSFISQVVSMPSAVQEALRRQEGDTSRTVINRVADTLLGPDEDNKIWKESFKTMQKITPLYGNMINDIMNSEDFIAKSSKMSKDEQRALAESEAIQHVRTAFREVMTNTANAAEQKGMTTGVASRSLGMYDARATASMDADAQIKRAQNQQEAIRQAQEATVNAPMNQVEEKITDMQRTEEMMNKGVQERVSQLRNSAFKKLDLVKSNRTKAVLGALAAAGGSVLLAGYGSQSPVPDADNTASQNMGQANTSARLVTPQQGAANGGYIINVATSTNQDPQAAIAALNNAPAFAGGSSATVTTRVTSQYEDMNANDIANYLDSVF